MVQAHNNGSELTSGVLSYAKTFCTLSHKQFIHRATLTVKPKCKIVYEEIKTWPSVKESPGCSV